MLAQIADLRLCSLMPLSSCALMSCGLMSDFQSVFDPGAAIQAVAHKSVCRPAVFRAASPHQELSELLFEIILSNPH